MKTATKRTDFNKVLHQETSADIKPNKSDKSKKVRMLDLEKTKFSNRFIEASCDCV